MKKSLKILAHILIGEVGIPFAIINGVKELNF